VVAGAGGIGSYIGGMLAAAGERVIFAGRPRVLEPIARDGLTVSDLDGSRVRVPPARFTCAYSIADAARQSARDDDVVVLLAVKSHATARAAADIATAFAPSTLVVSLQNGVENVARIRTAAPKADAVAAMVPYNVVWAGATHVHRATDGTLYVQDGPRTAPVAAAFARAGLATRREAAMVPVLWGKLLINLHNPVNALSGLPIRDELKQRDYRLAWAVLMSEGIAALRSAGIVPARILKLSPSALVRLLALPDPAFALFARRMAHIDPTARSSMADDLRLGRPTEIDDLCGAVVRLADRHGLPAPANAAMTKLAGAYDGSYVEAARLLATLRAARAP